MMLWTAIQLKNDLLAPADEYRKKQSNQRMKKATLQVKAAFFVDLHNYG